MKKMTKFLALAIAMIAFTVSTFGQATGSATATATIIAPIAISSTVQMNFGNAAVNATLGGTVILATNSTRSATAGVTLPTGAGAGTVTAASFDVTGSGTLTYAITLPVAAYTITRLTGTETMTVTNFVSNPSGTGALTAGAQTLLVGATLNVAAAQVPGTYTNATGFDVTVNYN
jgi:hypothetical protein